MLVLNLQPCPSIVVEGRMTHSQMVVCSPLTGARVYLNGSYTCVASLSASMVL